MEVVAKFMENVWGPGRKDMEVSGAQFVNSAGETEEKMTIIIEDSRYRVQHTTTFHSNTKQSLNPVDSDVQ